jgi:pimeloyl-ACP methyl ester carboxylesterase
MNVQHQFVQVGERRVFVRHAGQGPAVVLVHQSPQSGRSMLALMEKFAPQFAVFAPDTPGFGFSDPLPLAQPTIPDLARALVRLLDALGLQRVLLYGVHTGAVIAARVALERPDRVAALVCDGLALFNADERRGLLDGYLPPFEPAWDGSHLLWLWARLREQKMFFPWQQHEALNRVPIPLPSADDLHTDVLDVLEAGDGYRVGYRAAFLYEQGAATAAAQQVPTKLLYRDSDVLATHLPRLQQLPPNVVAQQVTVQSLPHETLAHFLACAKQASSADAASRVAAAASAERLIVNTAHGLIALRIERPQQQHTELVLPDIGCAASALQPSVNDACTVRVELPGHGASGGWAASSITLENIAQAVRAALNVARPGSMSITVQAHGGSAAIGAAVVQALGQSAPTLQWHQPLRLRGEERTRFLAALPNTQPDAQGGHLLAAWNWARQRPLFTPGALPAQAAIAGSAAPSPWRLHADVVEMLRAGPLLAPLWRAALSADDE